MTSAPAPDLPALHQAFGAALLGLQAYEVQMKALLQGHHIILPAFPDKSGQIRPAIDAGRLTLGQVAAQMFGTVLTHPSQAEPAPLEATFSTCVHIELPQAEYDRMRADLQGLVDLRNRLVHHFLAEHDLTIDHGRITAGQALAAAANQIAAAHAALKPLIQSLDQTRATAAEVMLPALRDMLLENRMPWPHTTIVQALQDAARQLQHDGWTSVQDATAWIARHHPDEAPESYGCRSWRQVLQDSGQFDLRYSRSPGSKLAQYRPKPGSAAG